MAIDKARAFGQCKVKAQALRPKLREDQEPKIISDNDKTKTRLVEEELVAGHDPE